MPIMRPIRRILAAVKDPTAKALPALEKARQLARALDAELVLFQLASWLLHLTDWELLRQSGVPLLLVKRPGVYRRPVVLAAVDPDHRYAKPQRLDREILQASAVFARALRGTLHVAHAYSPLPLTAYTRGTLSEDIVRDMQRRSARAAAAKLERLVRPLRVPASRQHLIPRHPSDAIKDQAGQRRNR
jgi:nucleotide-binding universal stress UspA family protein